MAKSLWTIPEKRKTSRHAAHDRRVRATGASATTTAASKSCAPILNRAAGSYPALAGAGRAAPRPPSPPRAHGPEVGHSVFVIPPEAFKAKRQHIVILNDVAWSIIESPRGKHPICVLRANRLSASAAANRELSCGKAYARDPAETGSGNGAGRLFAHR